MRLLYGGKFLKEKTFTNSEVCGYLQKFSLQNFGTWHLLATPASNSQEFPVKILVSTNSQKFSPTKVSCCAVQETKSLKDSTYPFPPLLSSLTCYASETPPDILQTAVVEYREGEKADCSYNQTVRMVYKCQLSVPYLEGIYMCHQAAAIQ